MTAVRIPDGIVCAIAPTCATHLSRRPRAFGPFGERKDPCGKTATHWIIAPDGEKVPGGAHCTAHAKGIVDEFKRKLGETWYAVPITRPGPYKDASELLGQSFDWAPDED